MYKESAAGLLYTGNAWDVTTAVATSDWMTRYDFDRNGNINKLVRNVNGFQMDDLKYQYKFIDGDYCGALMMEHNQLLWVDDAFSTAAFDADLEDQPGTMTAPNYVYDAAGNLKQDVSEELGNIEWDMYGKIKSVERTGVSVKPNLGFEYGPDGQRWVKVVMHDGGATDKQYYVRDACGECLPRTHKGGVLAVYTLTRETRSGLEYDQLHADEFHIYGGDRVGVLNEHILIAEFDVTSEAMTGTVIPRNLLKGKHTRGKRGYELKDHLGNCLPRSERRGVHVVVTDKRLWIDATGPMGAPGGDGTIDYFTADVMMSTDYYPFGSETCTEQERSMPGRVYSSSAYRYGFNGKEKDNEVSGEGASYDFGARMYDSRIGRWWSTDAFESKIPSSTPYNFAANSPIVTTDFGGNYPVIKFEQEENKVAFLQLLHARTGRVFDIEENGKLYVVNAEADLSLIDAGSDELFLIIKSAINDDPNPKNYLLINDEENTKNVFFDSFSSGELDLNEFSSVDQFPEIQSVFLAHIFSERQEVEQYNERVENGSYAAGLYKSDFRRGHTKGLSVEKKVFKKYHPEDTGLPRLDFLLQTSDRNQSVSAFKMNDNITYFFYHDESIDDNGNGKISKKEKRNFYGTKIAGARIGESSEYDENNTTREVIETEY